MVVDSSVWLEIVFSGPRAEACEKIIKNGHPTVPTLVFFEVYKKLKEKLDETKALEFTGFLSRYPIVELTRDVALLAADLSLEWNLAMADSIVLAHSRFLKSMLVTLDNDFATIPDVKVIR